jgi:hypothetical protein
MLPSLEYWDRGREERVPRDQRLSPEDCIKVLTSTLKTGTNLRDLSGIDLKYVKPPPPAVRLSNTNVVLDYRWISSLKPTARGLNLLPVNLS